MTKATVAVLAAGALLAAVAAPASAAPPRSAVVWAVGDGANGGANGRAVAQMIAGRRVDRFLYLGDVYNTGTATEFETKYRSVFGVFDSLAAPVIGNHEWGNRNTGYLPYWSAVRGYPMPLHYSFKLAGWQFLALESNEPEEPEQLAWLGERLGKRVYGTCRVAFMHHPRWSASTAHGDDPDQEALWSLLRGRARLVLAGHDHSLQRMAYDGGTRELISGAGGISLYPVDPLHERAVFADSSNFGALKLVLKPRQAIATFIGLQGQILDRSVTPCRPGRR